MVASTPRARASSISSSVSTLRPQFSLPMTLWCVTCVGRPPFSPISIVSLHAVEDAVRFVAHVRDVDAAHASRDLRELDHFGGRRERAGHVEQSGAQAERAVVHPLADEPAHLARARRRSPCGRPGRSPRRARCPGRRTVPKFGVTSRRRDAVEERLDRQRRRPVRPFDDRGHALPHVVVGRRHLEDAAARMRMDVDEPGRDDLAGGVDRRA